MLTVIAARLCMRVLVLCVLVDKAHGHCDCCEAMHAFVGVYVWAFTRHMRTLIAGRRCMRVLVVCCCALGACSV